MVERPTRPTPTPNPAAISGDLLAVRAAFLFALEPAPSFSLEVEVRDGRKVAVFGPPVYPPGRWESYRETATCRMEDRDPRARDLADDVLAAARRSLAIGGGWDQVDSMLATDRALTRIVGVLSTQPARTRGDGLRPPYQSHRNLATACAAAVIGCKPWTVRTRAVVTETGAVVILGKCPRPPWPGSVAYPSVRLPDDPNSPLWSA